MRRFVVALGIILVVAGLVGLIHPTFRYSSKEEVARIGPMQATVEEEKTATVPIAVSALLLLAGLGLAVFGYQAKK